MLRSLLLVASLATLVAACGSSSAAEDPSASGSAETAARSEAVGGSEENARLAEAILDESAIGEMSVERKAGEEHGAWAFQVTEHGFVLGVQSAKIVDGIIVERPVVERIGVLLVESNGEKRVVGLAWTKAGRTLNSVQQLLQEAGGDYVSAVKNVGDLPQITFSDGSISECKLGAILKNVAEFVGGAVLAGLGYFMCGSTVLGCVGAVGAVTVGGELMYDAEHNTRYEACPE